MKCLITPSNKYPGRVSQIYPNPALFDAMSEADAIAQVIKRNKEVGKIPCATKKERDAVLALHMERHPEAGSDPNIPMLVLPPIGTFLVCDDADLPEIPGEDVFFNAWEIVGNKVVVSLEKAREIQAQRIAAAGKPKVDLNRITVLSELKRTGLDG